LAHLPRRNIATTCCTTTLTKTKHVLYLFSRKVFGATENVGLGNSIAAKFVYLKKGKKYVKKNEVKKH
jgi:hypothetical protein